MVGFTEQELDTDPNKVGFSIQELENNTRLTKQIDSLQDQLDYERNFPYDD